MRRRVETIQALVAGSRVALEPEYPAILGEMNDVISANRMAEARRRRLLEVFHLARSADSTLRAYMRSHGWNVDRLHGIGKYLNELRDRAHHAPPIAPLSGVSAARYTRTIARARNRYLHQAGAYPAHDQEGLALLGEIDACLAEILAL